MGKSYWREFKKSVQDFYAPLNKEELYNKGLELYNKPKSDDDYIKALQYLQSAMILGYNKACEKAAEFCTKDPLNINNKKLGTLLNNIFINRMEGPPYDKMTFRIIPRGHCQLPLEMTSKPRTTTSPPSTLEKLFVLRGC